MKKKILSVLLTILLIPANYICIHKSNLYHHAKISFFISFVFGSHTL